MCLIRVDDMPHYHTAMTYEKYKFNKLLQEQNKNGS